MSSDIVLTSALRQNLLSLQNTQSLIDRTQLRLATGLKVASALDGPQNFFTAQSLNNRAGDLSRLLDGIGQSLRTIEAADQGVTALTNLIEQAQSIVSSARDELASSDGEARVVGNVDLSTTGDLVAAGVAANASFRVITTQDDGTQIQEVVSVIAGDTAFDLAARITDQFADSRNGEITANVTNEGFLSIQSTDGRSFRILDGDGAGANDFGAAGLAVLGIDAAFSTEEDDGVAADDDALAATVIGGSTATSISLFEGSGDIVEAGDIIGNGTAYTDADGNTVLNLAAGANIGFTVNFVDGTNAVVGPTLADGITFQDLVDDVNQTAAVNDFIEANFDSQTGTLSITSISDQVASVEINITGAGANDVFSIGLGDPTGNLYSGITGAGARDQVLTFNNSTETLDRLAADFNTLRDQIDDFVEDASYRGINLLNGDDLVTFFNEDNSNSLTTFGATFTSGGLGLTEASFRSSTEIELGATQTFNALQEVRGFGTTLANNLAIIQTRQTFTEQTINTLRAGADDLTVADQNEEGANLLALQTRQALGTTSLSLASQSQQSVLRLF